MTEDGRFELYIFMFRGPVCNIGVLQLSLVQVKFNNAVEEEVGS